METTFVMNSIITASFYFLWILLFDQSNSCHTYIILKTPCSFNTTVQLFPPTHVCAVVRIACLQTIACCLNAGVAFLTLVHLICRPPSVYLDVSKPKNQLLSFWTQAKKTSVPPGLPIYSIWLFLYVRSNMEFTMLAFVYTLKLCLFFF